jgi:hypothetical protein
MVNEPVLVLPLFWMFSVDLLLQMLQNLLVITLLNRLAWRNKFLKNNAFTVKKDHQHALDLSPDLPCFLSVWRGCAFPLKVLLFGFWVIPVNPGFSSCYDSQEEVLVVSDFIQQFLAE